MRDATPNGPWGGFASRDLRGSARQPAGVPSLTVRSERLGETLVEKVLDVRRPVENLLANADPDRSRLLTTVTLCVKRARSEPQIVSSLLQREKRCRHLTPPGRARGQSPTQIWGGVNPGTRHHLGGEGRGMAAGRIRWRRQPSPTVVSISIHTALEVPIQCAFVSGINEIWAVLRPRAASGR
jgi:hypothetical protein